MLQLALRTASCLLTAALLASSALAGSAKLGDSPSFEFRRPVANAPGLKSLADLRGKPVLVDFWGTHCPPCLEMAVPGAVKLAEQYGDSVAILLVEVQNSTPEQIAATQLSRRFLGTSAMWTTERPFDLGLRAIPHCALISPEGKIEVAGMFADVHGQIEAKLEDYAKAAKKAPAAYTGKLAGIWSEMRAGSYAKALGAAKALESDAKLGESAKQLAREIKDRIDADFARADACLESGYVDRADALASALAQSLKGTPELEARVAELARRLQSDAVQHEREAQKALLALEKKLYEKGPDKSAPKALKEVADKHAGTKSAQRATELAAAAALALGDKG